MECDCILLCLIIKNDLNDSICSMEHQLEGCSRSLSRRKTVSQTAKRRETKKISIFDSVLIRNIRFCFPTPEKAQNFMFTDLWEFLQVKALFA